MLETHQQDMIQCCKKMLFCPGRHGIYFIGYYALHPAVSLAKVIAAGCSKLFGFGLFLRIAILGTARFRLHYAAANGSQVAADSLPPYTIFRPAAKSFSFFDGNESGYAL
jgi:hypothetical protein